MIINDVVVVGKEMDMITGETRNVYGTIQRELTDEEAANYVVPEYPTEQPLSERVDALEASTDDIILMMAELIGGV